MTLGLFLTSLTLGVRHGVDWDHLAAIADLTSSADSRRRGFVLSLLYALGHAFVVFVIGLLVIWFGASLPSGVDSWMSRIVAVTLIALGLWVLVELVRKGRDFRLQSRWMLVLGGTFRGFRRVRDARNRRRISVAHQHEHEHDASHAVEHSSRAAHDHSHAHAHAHRHEHELALSDRPLVGYGSGGTGNAYGNTAATGIGMLHGVGVESPTQIAIFVAATAVGGQRLGIMLLLGWVAGLIVANAALALAMGLGVISAERNFVVYATVAVFVAVGSIAMGLVLLSGSDVLPDLLT